MPVPFPDLPDGYPTIVRSTTDVALPPSARSWNNSRYAYFNLLRKGERYHVQLCLDVHLGRRVCHKSLRKEIADDPLQQQLLLREARTMAILQHPHIPTVYDISRNKSRHFFTTQPIVGSTLREIIDSMVGNRNLSTVADLDYVADTIHRIGMALDFAHSHGVVHRNLKPENIVSGLFGEAFLLGWECADFAHGELHPMSPKTDLTLETELETNVYMANELVEGKPADARSDIFSLGAVLFELLTQQELAYGYALENMVSRVQRVQEAELSPSDLVGLETICIKCIMETPEQRYQTMHEVLQDIQYWRRLRHPDLSSLSK